jgi:hypothetical protein
MAQLVTEGRTAQTSDEIRGVVDQMVREYLGTPDLVIDGDGDIPVAQGSALYWVRVTDEDPVTITVWANVLADVPATAGLARRLAELNEEFDAAELYCEADSIMLGIDLSAEQLVAATLGEACDLIGGLADKYDDRLQREFGGSRAVDG